MYRIWKFKVIHNFHKCQTISLKFKNFLSKNLENIDETNCRPNNQNTFCYTGQTIPSKLVHWGGGKGTGQLSTESLNNTKKLLWGSLNSRYFCPKRCWKWTCERENIWPKMPNLLINFWATWNKYTTAFRTYIYNKSQLLKNSILNYFQQILFKS